MSYSYVPSVCAYRWTCPVPPHIPPLQGLAHHGKAVIVQLGRFDKQAVKLPYTFFCLRQTLLIYPYGFLAWQTAFALCPLVPFSVLSELAFFICEEFYLYSPLSISVIRHLFLVSVVYCFRYLSFSCRCCPFTKHLGFHSG